jgi:selenide, water dikinase
LAQVLRPVKDTFDGMAFPDLLVGLQSPDDAAVWKLDDTRDLVITTDFFTPVVDDPYDYGAIAAANSLSDVYAMGGEPFLALNIAALPPDLPFEISSEIIRGGAEKTREAGAVIAGGHTVQDKEPKFGLVVLGFVPHGLSFTKSGAKVGDRLFITKPLGFGVTTTALKREKVEEKDVVQAVTWMKRLNRDASRLARAMNLTGATDVTGYSLLGHASEMSRASGVQIQFTMEKIPLLDGAMKYAKLETFPGGAFDNRVFFGENVTFATSFEEQRQMLLFDPQTSGGLLLAVPERLVPEFNRKAQELDQPVWEIGRVTAGSGIIVE